MSFKKRVKAAIRAFQGKPTPLADSEKYYTPVLRVERPVQTFYATHSVPMCADEVLTAEHERFLLQFCGRKIVDALIDSGAFNYKIIPGSHLGAAQIMECRAILEVVMPAREEAET